MCMVFVIVYEPLQNRRRWLLLGTGFLMLAVLITIEKYEASLARIRA
jgi:hypothetical protein